MRILELLSEQTIGSIGSTTGQPGQVSQTPTAPKPADPNSPDANKPNAAGQTDPNLQKLAATLKQNKVVDNEQEVNDFLGAYQASTSGKTLNPVQQGQMAALASALLKNKNLDASLDLQLKAMSAVKPGTPQPTQQAPGGM